MGKEARAAGRDFHFSCLKPKKAVVRAGVFLAAGSKIFRKGMVGTWKGAMS